MTRTQSIGLAAVVAIVAIAAGMLLSRSLMNGAASGPAVAKATVLDPPRPLPSMQFIDDKGQPFGAERMRSHWSILFFGFTSCPDVCPTTLALLAQLEKQLGDLPSEQRPQIILVSVDPERDTPQRLDQYVHAFSPTFIGVSAGSEEATKDFTLRMGVPVAKTQLPGGGYTVDHSGAIFIVNPQGELRALSSMPHTVPILASDYRSIVAASPGS